ncbi:HAD family phosphatase [Pararhodobacter sp.]|uniref:HAD family hydrolase n=1 Tax=Pararhodobacter sp. TaxID=2127056 RepID=UPI002AFE79E2|nr:HAD family phosphatase [Pararhodobacter sp.]
MNIVFDIGNVLIRWRPEKAVAAEYPDPAAGMAYLHAVGFFDWNLQQDGGRSFADGWAALDVAHPGQVQPLAQYPRRFADTIREPIDGTWRLLDRLKARGHRLFAITNFAADTWPVALQIHPRLAEVFEDIIVSAHEKRLKPQPEIYQLLLSRNALSAADCLFIDDSAANVEGARAVGMAAHHFLGPDGLETDLVARGLL